MNISQAFGVEVKKRRLALRFSQEKLAELAKLHRTYIGAVERGERNITLISAHRIASALSISLAELLSGHGG